jgi:hypothetical protein
MRAVDGQANSLKYSGMGNTPPREFERFSKLGRDAERGLQIASGAVVVALISGLTGYEANISVANVEYRVAIMREAVSRLHKQWRHDCQDHFAMDFLPPYSPDLNPIERVWKLTRRQCLHNWYFPSLDEVVAAVESKFEEWAAANQILRRLCAIT